jgi:two-component system phosphate regulon sensor histidine kinase PhoR
MLQVREEYRREFLGNSHELKHLYLPFKATFLTLRHGAMEDKTIRKKYLKRAERRSDYYIVEDLDMITKLESGDLNLELLGYWIDPECLTC